MPLPPDRKLTNEQLYIVEKMRNARIKGGVPKSQIEKIVNRPWIRIWAQLKRVGASRSDLPNRIPPRRCAHCGRELLPGAHRGRHPGSPSFCHNSVSMECYAAYVRWRYKHDAEYRRKRIDASIAERRARRERLRGLPAQVDGVPEPEAPRQAP